MDVDRRSRVASAGGQALSPVMDIMAQGRMAVFLDASGAAFGSWQKGEFHGAGVVNEPGSLAWNELLTRDVEGAKAFYGAVFGLVHVRERVSRARSRTRNGRWTVRPWAGMMSLDVPQFPAGRPVALDDVFRGR